MRGVSPLVGAVFLTAIAVAVSALVGGWLSSFSSEQSDTLQNRTQSQLGCQFASVYVKNASYNCSLNCAEGVMHNLTLIVVNSGKTRLTVDSVTVQNTTGSIFRLDIGSTSIGVGSTMQFSNVSNVTCNGINGTIQKIIMTSPACPTAYDSLDGSQVNYLSC